MEYLWPTIRLNGMELRSSLTCSPHGLTNNPGIQLDQKQPLEQDSSSDGNTTAL